MQHMFLFCFALILIVSSITVPERMAKYISVGSCKIYTQVTQVTVCLQIDSFWVSGLESPVVLPRHSSSYDYCSWKKIEIPLLTTNDVVPLHEACQTVFLA